jgi:hypothetical protein
MLSIEECRKLIPDSEKLSNEQIEEIRRDHYDMIQLAFEIWLLRKKKI